MISFSHFSKIHRHLTLPVSVLLLSTALFSPGAPGHAGIHEEIGKITLRIRQDPANPQLYLQRGDLYRIHQDWDHALADFRKARQLDTTIAGAELGLGRTWYERGSPQQAMLHLNRALARQPGDVRALVTRAKTWRALGKPLAAAADYNRAIEYFPEPGKPLPEYFLGRARAYAAAGEPHVDKAVQGLDEGLQVLGNIQTLARYAVELEKKRGHYEAALIRLDSILARATRKEFLLLERGDILVAANRHREARQDFLAAQAAIAALPPRHRYTVSVQTLETTITARLQAAKQQTEPQDDHEQ